MFPFKGDIIWYQFSWCFRQSFLVSINFGDSVETTYTLKKSIFLTFLLRSKIMHQESDEISPILSILLPVKLSWVIIATHPSFEQFRFGMATDKPNFTNNQNFAFAINYSLLTTSFDHRIDNVFQF